MKALSAQLDAHYQQSHTTLTQIVKFVLVKHQPRIVEITNANPGVVTTKWPHKFVTGDRIKIGNGTGGPADVKGMTEVNDQEFTVTVIDSLNFSIGVDTTSFGLYERRGEARKVLGFTSHIKELTVDGLTYKPARGWIGSNINYKADLSVADAELTGLLDSPDIKESDIERGLWFGAEMEAFEVNYEDLTQGKRWLPLVGHLGGIEMRRPGLFIAEFRSLEQKIQQQIGELYSLTGRADLGDDRCKVRLEPPVWRASTAYTVRPDEDAGLGSVVRPSVYNERHFKCVTAGTSGASEPTWDTTIENQTNDGTVVWEAIDALQKESSVTGVVDRRIFIDSSRIEMPAADFVFPITGVTVGSRIFKIEGDQTFTFPAGTLFRVTGSAGNDRVYRVVASSFAAGKTSITVFEEIKENSVTGSIERPEPGWFSFGLLAWLSGANLGIRSEIRRYGFTNYVIVAVTIATKLFEIAGDQTAFITAGDIVFVAGSSANDGRYTVASVSYNGITDRTEITVNETIPDATVGGNILAKPARIDLFDKMPDDIQIADQYEMSVGCDKSKPICITKFDNLLNMRAEPEIPGGDELLDFIIR